ncbi:MAG TPA: exodeoxyribonuclease VII large subunit, partial [Verrucomicrobiae bacterium]|nr:exodeoxyribonuclease VII large subunit [Verrucomicrobiae bacterium]
AEGLFEESRKRGLPYPPARIGLVTSKQSAAYADFIKVLNARWQGVDIQFIDIQVQGEAAPAQIVAAVEQFNSQAEPPEVVVIIRGGGSAEDLAAFSTEQVTRAVAASRVPTVVAIGHEIDLSLAELAADRRASTPSNAAELLVPERLQALAELQKYAAQLQHHGQAQLQAAHGELQQQVTLLNQQIAQVLEANQTSVKHRAQLLEAFNPEAILRRGYAIVRKDGRPLRSTGRLTAGGIVEVQLAAGRFGAIVNNIQPEKSHD